MSQSCSCCFRDRVEWSHNFILRQINTSHTTSLHTPKKRAPPSLSTPVLILHSGTIMAPKQKKNKLKISLDLSQPIKKQQKRKYCNFLDVFDTSVPHIKVVVPTRADIPAGLYLKPIVEAFEDDDDGELSTSMKILQCCHRKGEEKEDGSYDYMPKAGGSRIPWDQFVAYIDDDDTDSKSLGVHIAKKLTEFVKSCSQVRTQSIVVMIRKLISPFCILYVVRQ